MGGINDILNSSTNCRPDPVTEGRAAGRVQIAASLLGADHGRLFAAAVAARDAGAELLHIDVMDGRFVPNLAFGPGVVRSVAGVGLPMIVHLMTVQPETMVAPFIDAGASYVTFHLEATAHPHRLLGEIRRRGARAGLALNPGTPLPAASELIGELDLLLVMAVNPGFGGQSFIPATVGKVRQAAQMLAACGSAALLEVDGGVAPGTAGPLVAAGCTVLAAGSSLFAGGDVAGAVSALRGAAMVQLAPGQNTVL